MGFASSYEMRERIRTARRWFDENRRVVIVGAAGLVVGIVWAGVYLPTLGSDEMVILYRPSRDGSSVVFHLGDEYRVRTVRLVAIDDAGEPGETLWRYRVPRDAPRVSTFSLPPRGPIDEPMPPIEPGRPYRLLVSTSGGNGSADFTVEPARRRPPAG